MRTGTDTAVHIHRVEHVHLAALLSTVGCSRLFVRGICASWQLAPDQTEVAVLLASELVSNAVTASGVTKPRLVGDLPCGDLQLIGLRLLALDDSFVIEVWDTSPRPPRLISPDDLLEHGRGLFLVDALSIRWGYYHAPTTGKVVWCQVALNADSSESDSDDDADESRRVLQTLQARQWNEHA
jgi:anti-sigma regulatory factor (Ser/Thr protein kinase)